MRHFVVVIGRGNGRGDIQDEFPFGHRFFQDSEGLGLGGVITELGRVIGRDQNAGGNDVDLFQLPSSFQARQSLHVHIEQGEMNFLVSGQFEGFLSGMGLDQPKKRLENFAERTSKGIVVIGD